ncbi:MAG: dephospho-CoA kinase [Bacteroidales bacterium]|jgi:dephospho-CoA kinase|nr:dephospho-CoA kinase [Bacteroidales bacterium]
MIEVGLSGGIGSGKTSVSKVFKNLGIPIYYADIEAKKIMNSDPILISEIISILGSQAYVNKKINKQYIAKQIFSDTEKRKKIESCVHKSVKKDYKSWVSKQKGAFVIHENALMFARNTYTEFDKSIYVFCPENIRIARIAQRDNISEQEIRQRMSAQAQDNECIKKADFVIHNDNTELIIPHITQIYSTIKQTIHG